MDSVTVQSTYSGVENTKFIDGRGLVGFKEGLWQVQAIMLLSVAAALLLRSSACTDGACMLAQ